MLFWLWCGICFPLATHKKWVSMAGWRSTRLHVLPQSLGVNLILCTSWFIDENGRHHQLPHIYRRELLSIFLKRFMWAIFIFIYHLPKYILKLNLECWTCFKLVEEQFVKWAMLYYGHPLGYKTLTRVILLSCPRKIPQPKQSGIGRGLRPTLSVLLDVWILHLGCFDISVAIFPPPLKCC